jgi:hypothetical protein
MVEEYLLHEVFDKRINWLYVIVGLLFCYYYLFVANRVESSTLHLYIFPMETRPRLSTKTTPLSPLQR